ncbi:hypothetical protein N9A12_03120 [Gammaproteobacteria bacterium]|nr:hypothetical protein [Gammaproteobacteria bacterium]
MKKLLTVLPLLAIVSCSKELKFECLDFYEFTIDPKNHSAMYRFIDDETFYNLETYSKTQNETTYIMRGKNIIRFDKNNDSLSFQTSVIFSSESECNRIKS